MTYFSLKVKNSKKYIQELYDKYPDDIYRIMALDGSSVDEGKWYEHEEDMCELSAKYPKVLFILYGEDCNDGRMDLWHKYFKAGKCRTATARITYQFDDDDTVDPDQERRVDPEPVLEPQKRKKEENISCTLSQFNLSLLTGEDVSCYKDLSDKQCMQRIKALKMKK
jgi:hypothetical protein